MTQSTVATRAKIARGYYSQIENSKRVPPPPQTLLKIKKALNLNLVDYRELERKARAERCENINLPREIPSAVKSLLRALASAAHRLPEPKIKAIQLLLIDTEDYMDP